MNPLAYGITVHPSTVALVVTVFGCWTLGVLTTIAVAAVMATTALKKAVTILQHEKL
jgi:hypothetical protein